MTCSPSTATQLSRRSSSALDPCTTPDPSQLITHVRASIPQHPICGHQTWLLSAALGQHCDCKATTESSSTRFLINHKPGLALASTQPPSKPPCSTDSALCERHSIPSCCLGGASVVFSRRNRHAPPTPRQREHRVHFILLTLSEHISRQSPQPSWLAGGDPRGPAPSASSRRSAFSVKSPLSR